MSELNETPRANRIHIAFFGLRNAGKSTLVNAFTNQPIAIVSATPGTTTDPVSKAMEIPPLGPCLVTDTAGLDDEGELGRQRVARSLRVLETADIAVWVWSGAMDEKSVGYQLFAARCAELKPVRVDYRRGEAVEEFRRRIAEVRLTDSTPGVLDGLVAASDTVVCVCPIDESAPKNRLILPQVQVIRACLDLHATAIVCQPAELAATLDRVSPRADARTLVVTDSQAFAEVRRVLDAAKRSEVRLTSFSVLFARQKGDLDVFAAGLSAARTLKSGDRVLIAEGCTHHRQCNDIGAVKIPKALAKVSGAADLKVSFASGGGFPSLADIKTRPRLIVHCGGCMLTRREILRRIRAAKAADVPILNYGILLAAAAGLEVNELYSGHDRRPSGGKD